MRSYSCKPCAVHVHHKEFMSPPPPMSHPLLEYPGDLSFIRSIKTHDTDTGGGGGGKFCGACSKPMRGCGYMSADGKSSFHPCCLHLDRSIKVNGETLELKRKNVSLKCNWCKTVSIRARRVVIPSWSYVSMGKDHSFHVVCVHDVTRESWRDGSIDQLERGKEEDHSSDFMTCLSLKIKLPIDPEEERDAVESAAQKVADLLMKDVRDGNNPSAGAVGDRANTMMEVLRDSLGALTRGVGSGSGQLWEVTKVVWRLLLLKIRKWIASLADTPVGRAVARSGPVTQPSKLWELIRPFLRWVCSKLCELASRMLTGTSSLLGRLLHDAQAYLMDSI
ncbi:uncharacterized protein LOC125314910 isoform X2 [Rhodamnia argentea]|uniref:Uncharacterized protein LOC125314910 isoform X2 n=1 Tax=Rhodamnia argentea TaxID=178133 RepID=A0ABM3HCB3_9MYRT|nr:uncharacterized protein LOC125314910 isoform X2 [Rhodamnia argentea]